MFVNFLTATARIVELMGNTEEVFSGLDPSLISQAKIVVNKDMAENEYILKMDDVSISSSDLNALNNILSITSSLKEMPKEMAEILMELSYKKEDLISDLKSGAHSFAVLFTNDQESIKALNGIDKVSHIKFFINTQKEIAEGLNVPFPGILAFNAQDKNVFRMPFNKSVDSIVSAISIQAFSQINQENFKYLQNLDQKLLYVIDKNNSFEHNKTLFNEAAKMCSGFAKFIFFTPEDVPSLIPLLKLNEQTDYPILISLAKEGKGIVRSVKPELFLSSVQNLLTAPTEKLVFASEIPADNESRDVKIVNTHTLQEVIEKANKDVLIAFTSPGCKFCKALEPELEKFSKLLSSKQVSLFVGNYNIMENEEPGQQYDITGVPTLYFYKKGSSTVIKVPSDARTVSTLMNFISREGETSKVDLSQFKEQIAAEEADKEVSEFETPVDEDNDERDIL